MQHARSRNSLISFPREALQCTEHLVLLPVIKGNTVGKLLARCAYRIGKATSASNILQHCLSNTKMNPNVEVRVCKIAVANIFNCTDLL